LPKSVKFVSFACTHSPLQDPEAIEWLIKNIKEIKPDYTILMGDMLEAASASRWDNEEQWSLKEEFMSADNMLKDIRRASGSAKTVFLPGNHDDNIISINRLDKRLRGLCDYRKEHNMPELFNNWLQPTQYTFDRTRGCFRLGQVTFSHGYECHSSSDEMQSILLGKPYGLFVSGHTHRPIPVTQAKRTATVPLPYWYANAGCLRLLDPEWVKRKRTHLWGHGLVCGEASLIQGSRESCCWSAETRIFQMKNDYTSKR